MYTSLVRTQYPKLLPEKFSPHTFRYSKATHLLQANLNIICMGDILGHNSVRYTEIYARETQNKNVKLLIMPMSILFHVLLKMESWKSIRSYLIGSKDWGNNHQLEFEIICPIFISFIEHYFSILTT